MTTIPTLSSDTTRLEVPAVDGVDRSPRTEQIDPSEVSGVLRKRVIIVSLIVLTSMSLVAGMAGFRRQTRPADDSFIYFSVRKIDLPITVTERGTLESQHNVEVLCEVDDVHGDGIYGTPILWLVDNGASVKKGDLLVELDAAPHLERLDQQILTTDQARAKAIQARINHENRISRNQTLEAKAELDVKLAGLALKQYEDEQGGTYQLELQDVELAIQEQEARKEIDDSNLTGIQQLFGLGYKSKGDLAQAELEALRAKSGLTRETTKREELVKYGYLRSKLKLQGNLDSAKRALVQVGQNNAALLAQAEAWKEASEVSLNREEERLARYREQLEKCRIYAPQDGMVAYAVEQSHRGQSSSIAEGVAVRDQQLLMTLPDLASMQVKTSVHESVIDRVKSGIRTTVRLDAFPDRCYEGTIKSVAVLPDPGGWFSSDTKVYQTVITIIEQVAQLKPGMTAVVEMHIDQLTDVLGVPVQALVQRGSETWCYVAVDGQIQRQAVTLGQTNDKFVEICSGLNVGDQVVLNPSAIVEQAPPEKRELAPDAKRDDGVAIE